MKKNILILTFVLIQAIVGFAQNATNFTANDCAGVSHDLFTELNAGKVVVITWVMPCSACISTARSAYDAVQTFGSSNPNMVLYYLVDDYANTNCQTLTSWGNTNQMPLSVKFSNSLIKPSDYGAVGMPKVVILGGLSHKVYYNEDNGANISGISPAIALALQETAINEEAPITNKFVINSIEDKTAKVSFVAKGEKKVCIALYSELGQKIKSFDINTVGGGAQNIDLDLGDLSNGLYIMKLKADDVVNTIKFTFLR